MTERVSSDFGRSGAEVVPDEDLLRRIGGAGDKQAFTVLMRRHLPLLRKVIYTVLGPDEDLEDVLQESLVKIWQALPRYRYRSAFTTWLYRIARNAAVDHIRRRRASRRIMTRLHLLVGDDGEDPEEQVLRDEERDRRRRLFFRLPEKDRLILLYRIGEGMTVEETASALGVAAGTVKSRLSRARRRALDLWKETENGQGR